MLKNIFLIAVAIVVLLSCKSEREKQVETINKEASKIFAEAMVKIKENGYNGNIDSLTKVLGKISRDSAELGLEYAKKMLVIANTVKPEDYYEERVDTTKYFELRLVNQEYYGSYAQLDFELKSLMNRHIDKFWLKASLRDKKGEYLAGEGDIMWDNIRPSGIAIGEISWKNIKLDEIGGVILSPNNLEVEGENYQLNGNNVRIISNKYGVKVTF